MVFILQRYGKFTSQQIIINMTLDVDRIIDFMQKFIGSQGKELKEQGETSEPSSSSAPSGGGTSSGPTIKKWESGRKFGKTYMNDPKYKWSSDRNFGKTYMNDPKYSWESGVTRGHANPVP